MEEAKVGRSNANPHVASEVVDTTPKNLNLQTLVTILNSTKATEIPGVIRSLSQDSQDTLMKYLYKGMALPGWGDVSGSVLLGWHEKVRTHFELIFARKLTVLRFCCSVDGGCRYRMHRQGHD